jgi:hypothetical protein
MLQAETAEGSRAGIATLDRLRAEAYAEKEALMDLAGTHRLPAEPDPVDHDEQTDAAFDGQELPGRSRMDRLREAIAAVLNDEDDEGDEGDEDEDDEADEYVLGDHPTEKRPVAPRAPSVHRLDGERDRVTPAARMGNTSAARGHGRGV